MPLAPEVQAIIDQMRAAGGPQLHELSPSEAREAYKMFAAMSGPAPEVAKVEDVSADGIPIRVYTPAGPGPLPLIVFFHGGGWVIGDLETHDVLCRHLANATLAVVVSVDYRLAPESKFPAAADDAYAATKWVHEQAAGLGGDPTRIALLGDSAGGNLTATTALMARDRGGPPITFQVLVYPVTDSSMSTASYKDPDTSQFLTREGMEYFWKSYLSGPEDKENPYCSPMHASDLAGLPAALVITAEYDPLRDEGEAYAARLRDAGVEATVSRYDGQVHGFVQVPGLFPAAPKAIAEAADALRKAFA